MRFIFFLIDANTAGPEPFVRDPRLFQVDLLGEFSPLKTRRRKILRSRSIAKRISVAMLLIAYHLKVCTSART